MGSAIRSHFSDPRILLLTARRIVELRSSWGRDMVFGEAFRPNRSITGSVWSAIMVAWAVLFIVAWICSSVYLVPLPLQVLSALGRAITGDGLIYELWTSM